MDPSLLWYLGTLAAMPIVVMVVLWLARQDMRRTITVLSVTAVGIGLAAILSFTLLSKAAAANPGGVATGVGSVAPTTPLLNSEPLVIDFAWTLQTAAWVLALYHAIQARRGRWLALILVCAVLSSLAQFFALNLYTMSYLASIALLSQFIAIHPFASLFTAGVLSVSAAGATLLYSRRGMLGVSGVRAKVNGLVPGAVNAPTREARAAALQADGAPEDVVFIVEDVPRVRG